MINVEVEDSQGELTLRWSAHRRVREVPSTSAHQQREVGKEMLSG